jgi:hypothetical protein
MDRETMAKVDGYTSAYGMRTWDEIVHDFYQEALGSSRVDESDLKIALQHTGQMTGDPAATMDPTLEASRTNRVV